VKFDEIAEAVRGVPIMTPMQARAIYDHIIEMRPVDILELGSAHGVSACYMAAALDENGGGHITTLDRVGAGYEDPAPGDLLEKVGLGDLVTVVTRDDSSYNWFLKEAVERQSDAEGNCEPIYDLCYLDGAHEWTIDGLAVVLVEKLLRPDGWLVLDDMTWDYASQGYSGESLRLSEAERHAPAVQAIFDLIVKQHPNFTDFKIQSDLDWGWAHKAPGQSRRLTVETSRSLGAVALGRMRERIRGHA
jgi:predicted O-methyltransferase YrrM